MRKHALLALPLVLIAIVSWAAVHTVSTSINPQTIISRVGVGGQTAVYSAVAVDTVLADADEIDMRFHRMLTVRVISGSVTSLTPYVASEEGGTYERIYDSAGVLIGPVTVAATGWFVLDEDMFPAAYVKFVSDADGTVDVCLKG